MCSLIIKQFKHIGSFKTVSTAENSHILITRTPKFCKIPRIPSDISGTRSGDYDDDSLLGNISI
jgi:hypothetical protein